MKRTYHFTHDQLTALLYGALDMFFEFREVHGHDEEGAKFAAVGEVMDGLDADRELAAADPTERLRLQLPPPMGWEAHHA